MPYVKLLILASFALCTVHAHFRGRARLGFWRPLSDHWTFMAPINCFVYLFCRTPSRPFLPDEQLREVQPRAGHWRAIRDKALRLYRQGDFGSSARLDDAGFNSFFKVGAKRFYLKWYGPPHPSATARCPQTIALLARVPTLKAAMFAVQAPGSRLVRRRDPCAGSLRYRLGLVKPNSDNCWIDVDGPRYSWRDGQAVTFDETSVHSAENRTDCQSIVPFYDI